MVFMGKNEISELYYTEELYGIIPAGDTVNRKFMTSVPLRK